MTDKRMAGSVPASAADSAAELAQRYYDDVYRYCRYVCKNSDAAYDITQSVFLRLLEYGVPPLSNEAAYIMTVARNLCFTYFSRSKRENQPLPENSPAEDDFEERIAERIALRCAIDDLPEKLREVILLFYMAELSIAEIAAVTGLSAGAVKTRLHRGRAALEKKLKNKGFL